MSGNNSLELLSPKEVAERLGVSRRTVWRYVSTRLLPAPILLTKRTARFHAVDVDKAIAVIGGQNVRS
jgi:excisionase family DNA binding protein